MQAVVIVVVVLVVLVVIAVAAQRTRAQVKVGQRREQAQEGEQRRSEAAQLHGRAGGEDRPRRGFEGRPPLRSGRGTSAG